MTAYQIFTDATADLPDDILTEAYSIEVLPMRVEIGGNEYTYAPDGTISVKDFYQLQRDGNFATTSQINPKVYFEYFEPHLRRGQTLSICVFLLECQVRSSRPIFVSKNYSRNIQREKLSALIRFVHLSVRVFLCERRQKSKQMN